MSDFLQHFNSAVAGSSGASIYAFANQASTESQEGIGATMEAIEETIREIGTAIDALRPEWVAMEADSYYGIIEQWKEGAHGIAGVLHNVRDALSQMHAGNGELRAGITSILAEMN